MELWQVVFALGVVMVLVLLFPALKGIIVGMFIMTLLTYFLTGASK
jgi:hypothetical protein